MPSKFNEHEITNLRNIIAELNKEIIKSKEQEQNVLSEFSSMNNDLVTLQRELAKNNSRLNEAKEQAVQASEAKSEFLALLSHEFRTPLNGILGMTEILSMSSLTEEQQQSVTVIQESSQLLLYLINDILDLSKLEAGEMKLNLVEMDVRAVLKHVSILLSPKAAKAGNKLYTEIDDSLSEKLIGDSARLTQILVNLVGNANKFTNEGTIYTRIKVLSQNQNEQKLRIEVSDNGIGIAEEEQSKLFRPYAQTLDGQQSKYGGTGLGLSICKNFVELMNGTIGVISEYGKGSTFWIEVSFQAIAQQEVVVTATEPSTILATSPSMDTSNPLTYLPLEHPILMAEDNGINRKVALVQLKKLGITNVETVDNGEEAVAAYLSKPYSVILMDHMMPKLDGLEATQKIRQIERDEMRFHTPIIALTGNVMQSERQKCLDAGMDDYLPKPISLETLRDIMQRWLPGMQDKAILNDEVLSELLTLGDEESNEDLLQTLLEMYQSDTPTKISQLIHYINSNQYDKAFETAHDLKSSSLSLGMEHLSLILGKIEASATTGRLDDAKAMMDLLMPAYEEACNEIGKLLKSTG
ncbi:ATP-binding protein [Paenibacillus sp. Marseille-Q4541]|uniref:ATP-binding protein n=1 Tax=Paenibacillus sp. Marseille-Q4541 TaxID=2831522 RepID=UPI001BAA62B3|nr:ATP-binding protein [Paenibacillus sp. Marseille-Q4541]